MLFGTVRRKLTALVMFSALSAMVAVPIVSWQMRNELIDRIDDRIPEAIRGFDQELADDVTDLDTTSRALAARSSPSSRTSRARRPASSMQPVTWYRRPSSTATSTWTRRFPLASRASTNRALC